MNLKLKASALILAVALPIVLTGCSSESSKVSKACALADKGSEGITSKDPLYTQYYQEAADILKDLAAKDPKYSEPYRAALLWASGSNLNFDDLKLLMTLNTLCSPEEEESN
jgi:hypothetical protein